MNTIKIKDITIGDGRVALIAGPCVIEPGGHALEMAHALFEITSKAGVPFIFKASFDKANRSSINSYRGPGIDKGLAILDDIKNRVGVPVISDVHDVSQVLDASAVLDVLQIPAFLCRQTDLLVAAGETGLPVNIKKGQFLAPWDMKNVVEKLKSTGNTNVMLTERGSSFGYNNLVCDMRSFGIMRSMDCPVVFDVTHSLQLPGGKGDCSGGNREFITPLARAGVAFGVDALFIEVHDNPDKALSDGPNSMDIKDLGGLLEDVKNIERVLG